MAKAGRNIEILKTGWTYNGRVYLMGEVVPVPPGLSPMDEEQQQEYYGGRVFYRLTEHEPNVGGKASNTWVPKPEPREPAVTKGFLAAEGATEIGGGSASFTPLSGTIPRSELPDDVPVDGKKKKHRGEDEDTDTGTKRQVIRLKKKTFARKKGRLVAASATKLSARR